jgi:hypothetical protein
MVGDGGGGGGNFCTVGSRIKHENKRKRTIEISWFKEARNINNNKKSGETCTETKVFL